MFSDLENFVSSLILEAALGGMNPIFQVRNGLAPGPTQHPSFRVAAQPLSPAPPPSCNYSLQCACMCVRVRVCVRVCVMLLPYPLGPGGGISPKYSCPFVPPFTPPVGKK